MGRWKLTQAIYSDVAGKIRAGRWVTDNPAEAQPGDAVIPGVKPQQLPLGGVSTISGVDSIDGWREGLMPFLTDEQLAKLTPNQLAELLALVRVWKKKLAAAEGLGCMPPSAVKAMTDVVDDRQMQQIVQEHRHGRSEPSGLSSPPSSPKERGSGWQNPTPLSNPPGVAICDQMMDVQDALDKRDLEKRLRGGWWAGKVKGSGIIMETEDEWKTENDRSRGQGDPLWNLGTTKTET
jgi:hypothetical protein